MITQLESKKAWIQAQETRFQNMSYNLLHSKFPGPSRGTSQKSTQAFQHHENMTYDAYYDQTLKGPQISSPSA